MTGSNFIYVVVINADSGIRSCYDSFASQCKYDNCMKSSDTECEIV